jgi:hypothetical protein
MFSELDLWKYSNDSNCWDYVCAFYKKLGYDLPKFGIHPQDKKGMTKASLSLIDDFVECGPVQNAIACHYHGKIFFHVGVVDGGRVRHVSNKTGARRDTIKRFESMAQKTIYRLPKCLA